MFDDVYNYFDTIPAFYGWTDKQTDRNGVSNTTCNKNGYDNYQSVQSESGTLSCNKTEMKCNAPTPSNAGTGNSSL